MMADPQHSKLIAARLRAGALRQPSVHPDADLLSAFSEGCLNQAERAKILEHLAECSVCRDVVYLAQPEAEAAVLQPARAPARARWLGWGGLRWAALAASMSVIVAVAILVRNNPERVSPTSSTLEKQASRGNVQPNISANEAYDSSPVAQAAEKTKNKEGAAAAPAESRNGAASDAPALASRRAFSRDEKDLGFRFRSGNNKEPVKQPSHSDLEREAIVGGAVSAPGNAGTSEEKGKLFELRQQQSRSGPYANMNTGNNAQTNQIYPPRDSQAYAGNMAAPAARPDKNAADKNGNLLNATEQSSVKPGSPPADAIAKKKAPPEQPVVPVEETHRKNLETIPSQPPAPKEEETVAASGRLQARDRATKTNVPSSSASLDEARNAQSSTEVAKLDDARYDNDKNNLALAPGVVPSGAITGWRVHHGRVQERLYGIWHSVVVGGENLKSASRQVVSRTQVAVAPQLRFTAVTSVGSEVWAVEAIGRDQSYVVVHHSHDNGLTWQASTLIGGAVLSPSAQVSISFKDPMQGELALSTGQRWQTADGGAHWTMVK